MKSRNNIVAWSILCGSLAMGCNAVIDATPGIPLPASSGSGGLGGAGGQGGSNGASTGGTGGDINGSSSNSSSSSGMGGDGGSGGVVVNACEPATTMPCYSGPKGTEGVGSCHAGISVCNADGSAYGECLGEVTPIPEDCATPVDDDCNGIVNDVGPTPTILSPLSGQTLPGGAVTFAWSGGSAPYEVEIAFDAAFTKPVMAPITTSAQSILVDGLNGGFVYWRVRGQGHCGPSAFAKGGELHLTCKQIQLRTDPVLSFNQPTIAWNAKDEEYGVVYGRAESGTVYLEFLRTDRLGNIVFGPKKLASPLLPAISGGYHGADIVYVASKDRWAVAYHRESIDQSHVALLDDNGTVLANQVLDYGGDTETQSVSYDPVLDRLVTSTDHAGNAWETYVQQFDSSLQKIGGSINTGLSCGSPNNGAFGPTITLPGLSGIAPAALSAFDFRESYPPDVHHLFMQRVDLAGGTLAWPKGTSFSCFAGKKIVPSPANGLSFYSSMAWNPNNQNVGVAYAHYQAGAGWAPVNDAYFAVMDPKSGQLLAQKTLLNKGAAKKVHTGMPKIAWDGEEFLVLWNDGRDANVPVQTRMAKFNGLGQLIGSGDQLFALPTKNNAVHTYTGKGLVGHDDIHTFVSYQWETSSTPASIWMCIEPPYATN